ncbi:histone H1-like [Lotus japonicus]|uniref:histone H1-like n=1 Tax=Lotus japonicus TaxID=34305 RepID=UPI002588EB24|nr:histone H1-like [Lotus japonicus]
MALLMVLVAHGEKKGSSGWLEIPKAIASMRSNNGKGSMWVAHIDIHYQIRTYNKLTNSSHRSPHHHTIHSSILSHHFLSLAVIQFPPISNSAMTTATKKAAPAKKPLSHPPFAEMITEAIASLKERTGSSQHAITKFIEGKHKELPPTFRKLILHQLKKSVAAGKLVKVKNSFKLAPSRPAPAKAAPAAAAPAAKKPKAAAAAAKPKPKAKTTTAKAVAKPKAKAAAAVVKKASAVKPKAVAAKPKAKAAAVVKAVKKVAAKPARKAPVKAVKKPKSVKTPVKKAKK